MQCRVVVEFEIAQVDELCAREHVDVRRMVIAVDHLEGRWSHLAGQTDVAEKQERQHPGNWGCHNSEATRSAETGRHDQPDTEDRQHQPCRDPDVDRTVAGARDDRRNAARHCGDGQGERGEKRERPW